MKRDSGFYWVKLNKEWIIAKYSLEYESWTIVGSELIFEDNEFEYINEIQIKEGDFFDPKYKTLLKK